MVHIILKTRISVTKGIKSKAHPSKIITFLGHFLILFVNWSNLAICGQSSVTVFSEKNSMCLNAVLTLKCPDISNVLREQRSRATNETLIKSLKKSPRPPQTGGQARPTAAKLLSWGLNFLPWPSEGSIPSHMEANSRRQSLPTVLIKRHILKNRKGVYLYTYFFPRHNPYLCKIIMPVFNRFQWVGKERFS